MAVYKRGEIWWYRFVWEGREIRLSSKQGNKRVAEQMQAAHRTSLAKGEVGLREAKKTPTLKEFAEGEFMVHVRNHFEQKPATVTYYASGIRMICAYSPFASLRLDEIKAEQLNQFIQHLKGFSFEVSTINRKLQVLRRVFKLAMEWERTTRALPMVRLLPGEKRRERVLSIEEEEAFLDAARSNGEEIMEAYKRALSGIRATMRGEEPQRPRDPFALYHLSVILLDCALRPEEAYRLKWTEYRDGALHIRHGKTASARRVIPVTERGQAILEMRREEFSGEEWIFPAPTKLGHVDQSSLKRQHAKACTMAEVAPFVPYTFRHTRLTRWAEVMDPYTLAHLAGHADFSTTKRYVHPREETIREAMRKAEEVQSRHKIRHSDKSGEFGKESPSTVIN